MSSARPARQDDAVTAAEAIVPLIQGDREAPDGCAALRELARVPLLRRAVDLLARSASVGRVLVPVPAALLPRVGELLAAVHGVRVHLVPVPDDDPGAG